eukprot:6715056-Prymnesium_polylepis.1
MQSAVTHAAWQVVGNQLFLIGASCTLALEPIYAALALLVCGLMLHLRAQEISYVAYGVTLPDAHILYTLPAVVLLFSAQMSAQLARRDFMMGRLLQVIPASLAHFSWLQDAQQGPVRGPVRGPVDPCQKCGHTMPCRDRCCRPPRTSASSRWLRRRSDWSTSASCSSTACS